MNIQDLIYRFEEGAGVRTLKWVLAVLCVLALAVVYDIREFRNFSTPESMDLAQLGRNVAEGRGFTTQFIRPLSLLLRQRQMPAGIPVLKEDHPDLANPPVYPLLLAALLKVAPVQYETQAPFGSYSPEVWIAVVNQVLFFGVLGGVYLIGRRLFDAAVGAWAAVLVGGTDLFWRFSVSGLPTILLMALFLGVVWLVIGLEQHQRENTAGTAKLALRVVGVGVLLALGGLTQYGFLWLVIPVGGYLLAVMGARRLWATGLLVAVVVVLVSPWLMRNWALSGHWFGTAGYALYQGTEPFPGNRLERHLNADFEDELARVGLRDFRWKLTENLAQVVRDDLPRMGGNWVVGFFLVSLLMPFRNLGLARMRYLVVGVLVTLTVLQCLGRTYVTTLSPGVNSENWLMVAAPLLFVFGTGQFFVMLDQIEFAFPPMRASIPLVFAGVMCAPLFLLLLPPRSSPGAWPPYFPPHIQNVSHSLEKGELMMSDMPWAVAWYGDRKCVWLTLDAPSDKAFGNAPDYFSIHDYQKPISGLYLTPVTGNGAFFSDMMKSQESLWGRFFAESFIRETVPTGFPLTYSTPGLFDFGQLFLTDRPRWNMRRK